MTPAKLKKIRVLLADDHSLVRRGVRELLRPCSEFEICAESGSSIEAIRIARELKPDLAVLDVSMPDASVQDTVKAIRSLSPATGIVVLSMHASWQIARELFRLGIRGYVVKTVAESELLEALRCVTLGKLFIPPQLKEIQAHQADGEIDDGGSPVSDKSQVNLLTSREREIVALVSHGKSSRQAAEALGLSTRTVESHRDHITKKMKFRNYSDLIRFAIRNELLEE